MNEIEELQRAAIKINEALQILLSLAHKETSYIEDDLVKSRKKIREIIWQIKSLERFSGV